MLFVTLLLFCSCGQNNNNVNETHSGDRDKVTTVTLTSIDDALPMIHSDARLSAYGDTLIIRDHKSTDRQLIAYDLNKGQYLGSFGKYGQGPGEIANFGSLFYDSKKGVIYGLDLSRWQIVGFNLREAIVDTAYLAFTKIKLTDHDGGRAINMPTYVNDSTIFCSVFVPDETGMSLSSYIGKFNLLTGHSTLLDSIDDPGRHTGYVAASLNHNIIVEAGMTHDRVRIYDLDGNLKRIIYGPDFESKHDGRTYYFSSSIIAGDKLLSVYSGVDARKQVTGHEIVVMDLDGNYIKTLEIGARIASIAYHDKTDRVYVSQDGEPQFGYFVLSEALGTSASGEKQTDNDHSATDADADSDADKNQTDTGDQKESTTTQKGIQIVYSSQEAIKAHKYTGSTEKKVPLTLIDPYNHSVTPVSMADIGASPMPDGKGVYYMVNLLNQSQDTVSIESLRLPDARFSAQWTGLVKYIPTLFSGFILKADKGVKLDDYRFVITYKDNKYPPQTFHINLHPDEKKLIEDGENQ